MTAERARHSRVECHCEVHEIQRTGRDGVRREYLFADPGNAYGLLVLFHPFGFDPEAVIWGEEPGLRLIRHLEGMDEPAKKFGFAVLAPRGRGRVLDAVSLAWREHLAATHATAQEFSGRLGGGIVCGGLSMGGLEALTYAGQFPGDVTAAWAVNPVVDLAAWLRDLAADTVRPEPDTSGIDLIVQEIGGSPNELPHEYLERTPLNYIDSLASVRLLIAWTPEDGVVPNAADAHAGLLVRELRQRGGWVDERIVTATSPTDVDAARYAHESCDAWSVAAFTAAELRRPALCRSGR